MIDRYLVHWSQDRYIKDIESNWLFHENASLFNIWLDSISDLNFTIMMSVYHALWIQVQDLIIRWWYRSLSEFYEENNDFLPWLVYFKPLEDNASCLKNRKYISCIDNKETYSYLKISEIWWLFNEYILKIINFTIDDFYNVEKNIIKNLVLKSGKERFFIKNDCNSLIIKDPKLQWFNLIDKDYLYLILKGVIENKNILWKPYE